MLRTLGVVVICLSCAVVGAPGVASAHTGNEQGTTKPVVHAPRIPAPTPTTAGTVTAAATSGWASRNWSGYAVTGSGFTRVTGSWRVPSVARTKPATYSASWVGIDGFNNGNLIQAGTSQDWSKAAGAARYYAWWEILPAAETPIPATVITVRPGDLIRVSITKGSPSWTITLANVTRGQSFTTLQHYTGPGTSAEWIEETPTIGRRIAKLAVYSLTTFNDSTVNGLNPAFTTANRGVLVRGKRQLSTPSFPSVDRDGFATQYGKLTPAAPPA
jgi:Peptidase A4 family